MTEQGIVGTGGGGTTNIPPTADLRIEQKYGMRVRFEADTSAFPDGLALVTPYEFEVRKVLPIPNASGFISIQSGLVSIFDVLFSELSLIDLEFDDDIGAYEVRLTVTDVNANIDTAIFPINIARILEVNSSNDDVNTFIDLPSLAAEYIAGSLATPIGIDIGQVPSALTPWMIRAYGNINEVDNIVDIEPFMSLKLEPQCVISFDDGQVRLGDNTSLEGWSAASPNIIRLTGSFAGSFDQAAVAVIFSTEVYISNLCILNNNMVGNVVENHGIAIAGSADGIIRINNVRSEVDTDGGLDTAIHMSGGIATCETVDCIFISRGNSSINSRSVFTTEMTWKDSNGRIERFGSGAGTCIRSTSATTSIILNGTQAIVNDDSASPVRAIEWFGTLEANHCVFDNRGILAATTETVRNSAAVPATSAIRNCVILHATGSQALESGVLWSPAEVVNNTINGTIVATVVPLVGADNVIY